MVWFKDLGDYWRFVGQRRPDNSQPAFSPSQFPAIILIALAGTALCAFMLDASFLAWARELEDVKKPVWEFITEIGKSEWFLVPSGLVVLTASVFPARKFRYKRYYNWHRIYLNCYFLFTAVALSGLLIQLLKALFGRARPLIVQGNGIWETEILQFGYDYASFPSGHACTAAAVSISLMLMVPKLRWFVLGLGLVIAISRGFVLAHFPSDIVAGYAFGAGFTYYYGRRFAHKRLLFKFTDAGWITLRGRGLTYMGLLPSMRT